MYLRLYVRCKKITVKEVLTLAHFDTGLVVLPSPAVKCQCCQIFIEKNSKQSQAHKMLKCPNALCFITPK